MKNQGLGIELQFRDFVDSATNSFCRHIKIINRRDFDRDVRLFMHQVFEISRSGRADTVLFEPDNNYILDYKGRVSLLIYAETSDGVPFDQFAVGNYGIEGKEGTFRDAEDGELSNNAVEHGGVDSVVRVSVPLAGNQSKVVDYWVIAASSQQDAEKVHTQLRKYGLDSRLRDTQRWWHEWFRPADEKLLKIDKKYIEEVKRSLLVIKSHVDRRGSILASGDSAIFNYGRDYYCYCWPRDGAYAVWPLIRLGFREEARNFFEFCRDIIHPDGYLMHKYQPDRAIGSTWHPLVHSNRKELAIQEDETAIVIIMLGEYLKHNGQDRDFVELLYNTLIQPAANFMSTFIDDKTNLPHASYDLWEEKFLTTTYTVATTFAALKTAANFAEMFGYADDALAWQAAAKRIESGMSHLYDINRQAFCKGYLLQQNGEITYDTTLDVSSMYGMFMFGPKSMLEKAASTAQLVERVLMDRSPSAGAPRYEQDSYMRTKNEYAGNPWFVCSLWMAQYYNDNENTQRAYDIMQWVMGKTLPSGILSEQIDPVDSTPVGVAPLVWSHAEFINTALDISGI
jgi:GH15 family glucan-1,4-alpha-glucosidase